MKVSKEMWALGLGPAVGVVVPVALKNYVEPNYGKLVPVVGEAIGYPWGCWSVFVPMVTGAAFFLVALFVKSKKLSTPTKYFLGTSGVTMLVTGLANGIWAAPVVAQARAVSRQVARAPMQATVRPMGSPAMGATPTGMSGKIIYS